MQEKLSSEEEIRNKTVSREKEIQFFSYFPTHTSSKIRPVKLENQRESQENKIGMPLLQNQN
jgi:hypothetical protein